MLSRLGLLASVSLAIAAAFVVGCGGDGLGAGAKPTLAPTSVPPTFVRLVVTPQPTAVPTATPQPTATSEPFEIDLGDPVFPPELDPALVDVRPDDEVIFDGWTKYLTNTSVLRPNDELPIHLCANGLVIGGDGRRGTAQNWRITRSPAVSSLDWGSVAIRVDILEGRWAGRE